MPARRAFTMMEVLAVLALMALIAGIVAVNHEALLPALRARPPETALRESIRIALRAARESGRRTLLSHDPAAAELVVAGDDGSLVERIPCGKPGKTRIRFLPPEPDDRRIGDESHSRVEFSPAGYLRPVSIELTEGDRRRVFRCDALSGLLAELREGGRP